MSSSDAPKPSKIYEPHTERHNAVASWFLGPQGENFDYLKRIVVEALDIHRRGRKDYFPQDQPFITRDMQNSDKFKGEHCTLWVIITMLYPFRQIAWSCWNVRFAASPTSWPNTVFHFGILDTMATC
jgi:hypothetical protein